MPNKKAMKPSRQPSGQGEKMPKLTHADLDELQAHGLWLLQDDPRMEGVFAKLCKAPCSRWQPTYKKLEGRVLNCHRCLSCRARKLSRSPK